MSLHHTSDIPCLLCEDKLKTANPRLSTWFYDAKSEFPDLHISWAYRGKEEQEKAFRERKTHARWPHSKHNHRQNGVPCSLALDLFQLQSGKAIFCPKFYFKLNQFTQSRGYPILWGGTFKNLKDHDHFELKTS